MITTQLHSLEKLKTEWSAIVSEGACSGYVWMSNADKPLVLRGANLPDWENLHGQGGFIYESCLYFKDRASLKIRQLNDQWQISRVTWNGAPPEDNEADYTLGVYLTVSDTGFDKMKFLEKWEPRDEDNVCPGFKSLQPAWSAFIGFNSAEEK